MKTTNNPHYLVMALMVAVVSAATWSCNKDDDPSLADLRGDKLQYLEDSLRISDSLKRINSAGVVNYAITVVSGSTSTLFKNDDDGSRVARSKAVVAGAVVTISQFGKIQKDTTDASGMVVFKGFFRTSVNVTVEKDKFTTVSYISVLNKEDSTINSGIYSVGNLIPIFELEGQNTATIKGRATIQTNLTNRTRESVPNGTTITANIDASNDSDFAWTFLTSDIYYEGTSSSGTDLIYVGNIVDAAYSTNIIGTINNGAYSIVVPAAVNGLPLNLEYSAVDADQTLYEFADGNKLTTYSTIFDPNYGGIPTPITAGAEVGVSFTGGGGAGATGFAVITNGAVSSITLTSGGAGYTTAPTVTISTTSLDLGSGATATATTANGVVNGVTITAGGSGYVSANFPAAEVFSTSMPTFPEVKPGLTYINDIHYGTGVQRPK
jgi:hypothetical protein